MGKPSCGDDQYEDCDTVANAPVEASLNVDALIASLRAVGADRFDPIHFHYIEVLAKRAVVQRESVRRMLYDRLLRASAVLKAHFEQSQSDASATVACIVSRYPHATADLQRLFIACDFKGVHRFAEALETSAKKASLGALVRQMQPLPGKTHLDTETSVGSIPELKTVRSFRNTWAKLSVDRQVAQALQQAPQNAGPINSHMLMLRSLTLMRDISPHYLNRFMSYADTLLCLDQLGNDKPAKPRKRQAATALKK